MKNKKKKILFLIILILFILTACILIFNIKSTNTHKKEKTLLELESNTIKKEKSNSEKEEVKADSMDTNISDLEIDKQDNNSNKANNNQNNSSKTTNTHNNSTNTSSPPVNNNQPVQNNTPQPPAEQKPIVDNRTAWEKLGISEYDYYHTEMYGARVDLYNTDISFCNSEAKRILNSYEDVANTRSYSGTGKYTYSYIGCSVDVTFYDGRTVGYNEAKRILGF